MTVEGSVLAGKYRLVSLIGEGGMGAVWRAEHLDLHAPVAIKLLNPMIAATGDGVARFLREAQAAAALRSPHVVQIFDRGVDEATRQPFIAMELMDGESLAGRLVRQGELTPEQTCRVITHVARALARAHEAGIVHRDLKPDNVFLVRNEDAEIAKVLDFGIAKTDAHGPSSPTRTGAMMGTPHYMSPEQISGSKAVDFRADLWALGVMACECLTGKRPFEGDSIGGLALLICVEPAPRASALGPVPPGFDTWFERATTREPAGRFQSAREMADELRRICGLPSAIPDRPTGSPEPPVPVQSASTGALVRTAGPSDGATPARARRVVTLLALAGSIVGAVALSTFLWSDGLSHEDVASDPSASALVPSTPKASATSVEATTPSNAEPAPPPATSASALPTPSEKPSVRQATPSPKPLSTGSPRQAAPSTTVESVSPSPAVTTAPKEVGAAIKDRR